MTLQRPEAPAPRRRETCRYCYQEVILGKHGWRLDNNSASGNTCEAAPRGYHGISKPPRGGGTLRRGALMIGQPDPLPSPHPPPASERIPP